MRSFSVVALSIMLLLPGWLQSQSDQATSTAITKTINLYTDHPIGTVQLELEGVLLRKPNEQNVVSQVTSILNSEAYKNLATSVTQQQIHTEVTREAMRPDRFKYSFKWRTPHYLNYSYTYPVSELTSSGQVSAQPFTVTVIQNDELKWNVQTGMRAAERSPNLIKPSEDWGYQDLEGYDMCDYFISGFRMQKWMGEIVRHEPYATSGTQSISRVTARNSQGKERQYFIGVNKDRELVDALWFVSAQVLEGLPGSIEAIRFDDWTPYDGITRPSKVTITMYQLPAGNYSIQEPQALAPFIDFHRTLTVQSLKFNEKLPDETFTYSPPDELYVQENVNGNPVLISGPGHITQAEIARKERLQNAVLIGIVIILGIGAYFFTSRKKK